VGTEIPIDNLSPGSGWVYRLSGAAILGKGHTTAQKYMETYLIPAAEAANVTINVVGEYTTARTILVILTYLNSTTCPTSVEPSISTHG